MLWLRGNQRIQSVLKKNRFIYPFSVVWLISTLSFPPWFGQFYAADIGTHDQIHVLFSNYTWTRDHRTHHKFSETHGDPHNAKVT